MATVVAVSNATPRAQVLGVSDLSFDECCEGRLLGRDHSSDCPRLHAFQHDATARDQEVAMAMQAAEFQQAEAIRAEAALRMQDVTYSVVDPLWGEVTTNEAPSAWFRLLFCCCPCCIVGCSTKEAKRAWFKFLCSCSFILAVLQVAILVAVIAVDGGMVSYEENPMFGPKFNRLDEAGGKNAAKILLLGDWWRLASATMLHAGWIHLVGNLVVQLHAGVQLEVIWGPAAWLVVYFVSGIYANLLSCVLHPDTIGVGSSGCLCGLIGGWLSFIFITWNQTLPSDIKMRNAQVTSIVLSILMVLVFSFLPLMDFAAHVGGLIMGTGTSMVMFGSRLQHVWYRWATIVSGAILFCTLWISTFIVFVQHTTVQDHLLDICQRPNC